MIIYWGTHGLRCYSSPLSQTAGMAARRSSCRRLPGSLPAGLRCCGIYAQAGCRFAYLSLSLCPQSNKQSHMPSKKTSHTIDEIYKKISRLCAKKELSEYDALQYLKKFKISPQETLSILQKLKADNFIDNRRFVRAYIHDKLK